MYNNKETILKQFLGHSVAPQNIPHASPQLMIYATWKLVILFGICNNMLVCEYLRSRHAKS